MTRDGRHHPANNLRRPEREALRAAATSALTRLPDGCWNAICHPNSRFSHGSIAHLVQLGLLAKLGSGDLAITGRGQQWAAKLPAARPLPPAVLETLELLRPS